MTKMYEPEGPAVMTQYGWVETPTKQVKQEDKEAQRAGYAFIGMIILAAIVVIVVLIVCAGG